MWQCLCVLSKVDVDSVKGKIWVSHVIIYCNKCERINITEFNHSSRGMITKRLTLFVINTIDMLNNTCCKALIIKKFTTLVISVSSMLLCFFAGTEPVWRRNKTPQLQKNNCWSYDLVIELVNQENCDLSLSVYLWVWWVSERDACVHSMKWYNLYMY